MTAVVLGVAAILAAVAAAGVVGPFRRPAPDLDAAPDPLEEERRRLLRNLRDLDEERATGALTDDAYRALRGDLEARTVAVLRTLESRNGEGTLAEGLRDLAATRPGRAGREDVPRRGRSRSVVAVVVVGAVAAGAMVALLSGSLRDRSPGEAITGDVPGQVDAVTFFERRVRQHPDDLAARLDLGQRYLERGDAEGAVEQYLEALRIDPRSAEAHAQLGFVLHAAGRPEEGLQAVDRALEIDPRYPLALYYRGLILLEGLDRPRQAADALEGYLREAPFGSFRRDAERLLERASALKD